MNVGSLEVRIHPARNVMGMAAARDVGDSIRSAVRERGSARVMFAAAPSQVEFLGHLRAMADIPWPKVAAFHMDEYLGLRPGAPQLFGTFLNEHLFSHLPLGAVHLMDPGPADPREACARYAALLREAPIDIVCMGIGENGHVAFNDPPVADFADPETVKVVDLDHACRMQQVHDGCFHALEAVPRVAMTVTVPALMTGRRLSIVVPGPRKAAAVAAALSGPVSTECPASVLRTHPSATLYLDADSAGRLR